MNWPLMKDSITWKDKLKLCYFLLKNTRLTQGKSVKAFETDWNNWLGSSYSVFVNSGSSANLLLLDALVTYYNIPKGSKILVPATTWTTTVSPIIQLGYEPIFCDVSLKNFGMDVEAMQRIQEKHPDIAVIFVAHLLGFASPVHRYKEIFPNAKIIQDICESHGVEDFLGKKYGSTGEGATFSFYYGHHMTSIEGGMVSTNNPDLYNILRMKRSHGLARESTNPKIINDRNSHIDPQFLFEHTGYNLRSSELYAEVGRMQLPRLNSFIEKRKQNFNRFHLLLSKYKHLFHVPDLQMGNSSFCLPFICKNTDTLLQLKEAFTEAGIEYRPIIAGNLLQHPAYKNYSGDVPNANLIHNNGVYVGNNQFIGVEEFLLLEKTLKDL